MPDVAVRPPHQITVSPAFLEQRRALGDVRIDPDADFQTFRLETAQHAFRVGKRPLVPAEVAPMKRLHPETVEMEDAQWNVPFQHAVDEPVHRRLVVVGRKRRRQPQAERPRRRQSGTTGQRRIFFQYVFHRRPVDDEIFQNLPFHAELRLRHFFRGDLERDEFRMVDEHAVAAVGDVKRHVFVRLFRARAAVAVPDVDRLAVFDERRKPFAEAVHAFADAEVEFFPHPPSAVVRTDVSRGAHPAARHASAARPPEFRRPLAGFAHDDFQGAAGQHRFFRPVRNLHRRPPVVDLKMRSSVDDPRMMGDAHADDAGQR